MRKMISKHCGEYLTRTTRDSDNFAYHRWRCKICKKVFKQRRRISRQIKTT